VKAAWGLEHFCQSIPFGIALSPTGYRMLWLFRSLQFVAASYNYG